MCSNPRFFFVLLGCSLQCEKERLEFELLKCFQADEMFRHISSVIACGFTQQQTCKSSVPRLQHPCALKTPSRDSTVRYSKELCRVAVDSPNPCSAINLLTPVLFFFNLAHPVYKMWIIQEPNVLELWKQTAFWREKKTESIYRV